MCVHTARSRKLGGTWERGYYTRTTVELSYTVCTGSHVLYCSYRFYTEDAAEKNDGYRAAGYTIELRDTGRYGFLLPPDQVPHINKP